MKRFGLDDRESPHDEGIDNKLNDLYSGIEFFDDMNSGALDKALMTEAR